MKLLKIVLSILLVLCLIIGSSFFGYVLSFRGRIYKNIIVAKTDIGGLTKDQAIEKLKFVYKNTPNKVELTIKGNSIGEISVDDVDRDFKWAVDQAYILSRSGDLFVDIKIKLGLLFKTKDLDLPISIRAEDIDAIVETVSGKVDQEPIWPALKKDKNTYTLSTGKDGLILNKENIKLRLGVER